MAVRRVLPSRRRPRRDHRAAAAAAHGHASTCGLRCVGRAAPAAAARHAARRAIARRRFARTGAELDAGRAPVLLNKLITGASASACRKLLVTRALARGERRRRQARRASPDGLHAHQRHARRRALSRASSRAARRRARPTPAASRIPFFLAHPLNVPLEALGDLGAGRLAWPSGSGTASARSSSAAAGRSWLWSRGEELVTERFPELAAMRRRPARRHRDRRRDRGLERRPRAALRRAAEAHRPQDPRQEAPARHARRAHGVRPARMGRASTCARCRRRERRALLEDAGQRSCSTRPHRASPLLDGRRLGRPGAPARGRARDAASRA